MRIISEFHDYYDVVQGMGQDQTLIYQRRPFTTDVKEVLLDKLRSLEYNDKSFNIHVKAYIIGFCGKIYPIIEILHKSTKNKAFCFKIEEVDEFVKTHCKKSHREKYFGIKWTYNQNWGYHHRQDRINEFFLEAREKRDSFNSLFVINKCPIFVHKSAVYYNGRTENIYFDKIYWNESLKEYEFYRILEPYTAFQELQMFMSNQAMPEKPIPTPSDEVLAEIKGFDRYSFRKDKSK